MSYLTRGLGAVAQGVGGLVFGGGERSSGEDDGGVEHVLERISNGVLAEDRRAAVSELRDIVAENPNAQLALGAMGFPVLLTVLKEERADTEMVRGALEALINGLVVPSGGEAKEGQLVPGKVNADLFAREQGAVALLLNLLEEEDFYIRYHTVQLLTVLLQNCPGRLQEAILASPMGVAKLMDMMLEREVIRNEALLLLANLTRSAEEIQKIVVFEGAFERLFNIVKEEGYSDGGIIVQDSLELLNNLIRNNPSNQVFLRESVGLQQIPPFLKLRKGTGEGAPRQKAANLLCALEALQLLTARTANMVPGQEANIAANQAALAQCKVLDVLLPLALENRISSPAVRIQALKCIGDLVARHHGNQEVVGSKLIGDREDEPALHGLLRVVLRATNARERAAAEYAFRCYCEGNPEGQLMLASTIGPQAHGNARGSADESTMSFGSMLVRALIMADGCGDLEASSRAASVLIHLLANNRQCKERVLKIPLEIPTSSAAPPELLMSRIMRYLQQGGNPKQEEGMWLQPTLLRLLITWLTDCPPAVAAFLAPPAHLPLAVELMNSRGSAVGVHVAGLAAVLLGVCLVFNESSDIIDAATVLDVISQRVGLPNFFAKWEGMRRSPLWCAMASAPRMPKALTRASTIHMLTAGDATPPLTLAMAQADGGVEGLEANGGPNSNGASELNPELVTFYDPAFVQFTEELEKAVKNRSVALYARPKQRAGVSDAGDFVPREGESEADQLRRLKELIRAQSAELAEVRDSNAALAEELMAATSGGVSTSGGSEPGSRRGSEGVAEGGKRGVQSLHKQVQELQQAVQQAGEEQKKLQAEVETHRGLASKHEADLRALSAAYNTLEQENFKLEAEVKELKKQAGGASGGVLTGEALEKAREEGRAEAREEGEGELNDLLVCLGQEEAKVQKLREVLEAQGQDVDALLEGIGGEEEGDEEEEETDEEHT